MGRIKGHSLWVNVTFENQKEINNSRHFCFPFTTSSLTDLLRFSLNLIDHHNKEIRFEDSEKKKKQIKFQD